MPALSNPKHEAFCQAYTKGKTAGNATASYKAAGFRTSRSEASRLRHDPNIAQRVAELCRKVSQIAEKADERLTEKGIATREWIIERLVENANRAMQAQAVLNSEGEPTGEYKYDGAVANKALELLGKERGMFIDRSERLNVNYVISDQPLTADEWATEYATAN